MAADPEDLESGGTPRVTNANDSSYDMEAIPSIMDNIEPQTTVVIPTHMTRLGFLWRRHVQSQSDNHNPQVQAWLERLWLLVLFLSPFVEGPLNYFLGNTTSPRSSDEFWEVLPLLAASRRVVGMDWDTGSARTHAKKQFLVSFAQLDPTAANLCYSTILV